MPVVSRFVRYAPKAAQYLLAAVADNVPYARRLVVSAPLTATDGGDGEDYTLAVSGATSTARGVVTLAGQLGGTADSPAVTGVSVDDGTTVTALALGDVGDGEVLVRSGTTIVGSTPGAMGAVSTSRSVTTGAGLTGGGDLTANRTLSIAAFTGFLSKDYDPGTLDWAANEVKDHVTYDAGADGALFPLSLRVPATVNAALVNEIVFSFDDSSTRIISNSDTATFLDQNLQGIANTLVGGPTDSAVSDGRSVRKIILRTRNTTGGVVSSINIGVYKVRAFAVPRGGGAAL